MHRAQIYVHNLIKPLTPGTKLSTIALNAAQAARLRLALDVDALSYLYSGVVSIGDATQAIERQFYSWATVKLYYALFYLSRALLAAHGTAVVYEGTKPFSWDSQAGATPTKRDGPTHKAVLSSYEATFPKSVLLSQPIDTTPALSWLMSRREEANYTRARFSEPEVPAHFAIVARMGIRKVFAAYVRDGNYLYSFDQQHAMLALPVEALKLSLSEFSARASPLQLNTVDRQYLASLFVDKSGPLADVVALFK